MYVVRQPEMVRQCNFTFYCAELHNIGNGTTEYTTQLYGTIFLGYGKLCLYCRFYSGNDDKGNIAPVSVLLLLLNFIKEKVKFVWSI